MVGTDVHAELHAPLGRMDTVVITQTHTFIFKFKVGQTADVALQYIKDKRYADRLRYRNCRLLALVFRF
ncbi:MAG: nuclease superfamily [Bacteroidota bacterium]|jgi:hypothetical protein